jgi:hypothetical protein
MECKLCWAARDVVERWRRKCSGESAPGLSGGRPSNRDPPRNKNGKQDENQGLNSFCLTTRGGSGAQMAPFLVEQVLPNLLIHAGRRDLDREHPDVLELAGISHVIQHVRSLPLFSVHPSSIPQRVSAKSI